MPWAQELEEAREVLEGRWKILILFHLFTAPVLRFSELRRAGRSIRRCRTNRRFTQRTIHEEY
ncbi:winged helix-turn-helix transcriptional regulator [Tunturibacter empetritectus]|uniref:winged helix-turn-helix transcriptional regulator n=1 Tax=Tunturiibacter empetritectus TaxID=3069691 RepID=UPI00288A819E|nr:winged helix-turn-helix transcriptional regulator [Edaphobacter lichenicola]